MKEKLRICFLTAGVYPVPAAEGGAVENLVELILDGHQSGESAVQFAVISCASASAEETAARSYSKTAFVFIKKTWGEKRLYPFAKRVFMKLLRVDPVLLSPYFRKAVSHVRKGGYDIVIVENKPQFIPWLRRLTKAKIVLHLHNDTVRKTAPGAQKVTASCDAVLAVSDYIKRQVEEITPAETPVVTVHNVINVADFSDTSTEAAAQLQKAHGILDTDIVLLYTGRLTADKGVDRLVEAVKAVKDPRVKLVVVGGSAYSDSSETDFTRRLKESAQELGDRVIFTGYVPYENLPVYYKAADIAVFPSQWEEPAGLVVVEAQAAGLPVVIADSGGMPEYVCPESAVIIPRTEAFTGQLTQAINMLVADSAKCVSMGAAGKQNVRRFDKHNYYDMVMASMMEALYGHKQNE